MSRFGQKHILVLSLITLFSCTAYYLISIYSIESSSRRTESKRSQRALEEFHKNMKALNEKQRITAEQNSSKYQEIIQPDAVIVPEPDRAVVLHRIETRKPVVFLTIDDGEHRIPSALKYMLEKRLNPTLFLTDKFVEQDTAYFKTFIDAGILIENHTITHPNMVTMSIADQKKEICDTSDRFATLYGVRPKLFRPPYGNFNNDTLLATKQCGIDYLIHWSALVDHGSVKYQDGNVLRPGDIVLMHYRPYMMDDLKAFYEAASSQGLTPANLADWLK